MTDLRNCEHCGKLFRSSNLDLCPLCVDHDEYEFKRIKEFLNEHPCAKIFEVVNSLDIKVKTIKRYLRESRLEILEQNNKFLFCEACGKPIRSGKYCDDCYKELYHDYKSFYARSNPKYSDTISFRASKIPKRPIASTY